MRCFRNSTRACPALRRFGSRSTGPGTEYPDLNLVVAGMNSTVAEIHDIPRKDPLHRRLIKSKINGHFGWIGEPQIAWFKKRLEAAKENGLFRIGVVHHNRHRAAVADEENLRDSELMERELGDCLNLILHGHTHDSAVSWVHPSLPVISTGSAALVRVALPDGIPNQYQLVRISTDRLERWTRRFDVRSKRWEADTRCSSDGNDWYIEHRVPFASIGSKCDPPRPDPDSSLIEDVANVYRWRTPNAVVQPYRSHNSRMQYLRVRIENSMSYQEYPVGFCDSDITLDYLEQFTREVVANYRAKDRDLEVALVHLGQRATKELIAKAEKDGIRILTYIELQNLIDFNEYRAGLDQRLSTDKIYPSQLYVPQRMTNKQLVGMDTWTEWTSEDAFETVSKWMRDQESRFILILADAGVGKTFLVKQLARQLVESKGAPVPVLIDMRDLNRAPSLNELIAQHLGRHHREVECDIDKFRNMMCLGRIVLLFDGFDELAQRVTFESAADHFRCLLEPIGGKAKIVVTGRSQFFESDRQMEQMLLQDGTTKRGIRMCHLLPFKEEQVLSYLARLLGTRRKAAAFHELICDIDDLRGLSENPRMLGFICGVGRKVLRQAQGREGTITSASLYKILLDKWLEHDISWETGRGAAPTLI